MPAITAIALSALVASAGGTSQPKIGNVTSTTSGTVGPVTYTLTDDAGGLFFLAEGYAYELDPPAAIYGTPAGMVLWAWNHLGWTMITADWADLPLWYHPLSLLIYLFVQDTCFYWSHRWMHRPKWFRLAHAVHHDSRPPTAWTAMSFHPIEAVTGAIVVPVLVFLVPIHLSMLGLVLTVATVMGVTNHMGWEMFPRWLVHSPLGNWLITASHHERHHEEYRCNYGLYFRVWDRLCGTDKGLSKRIVAEAGHGARVVAS
jgi:sterol desaturase/sphingolipid hydroxylase (fatty acid hydroxylase superfamily)